LDGAAREQATAVNGHAGTADIAVDHAEKRDYYQSARFIEQGVLMNAADSAIKSSVKSLGASNTIKSSVKSVGASNTIKSSVKSLGASNSSR